jgi:hypothetical protein
MPEVGMLRVFLCVLFFRTCPPEEEHEQQNINEHLLQAIRYNIFLPQRQAKKYFRVYPCYAQQKNMNEQREQAVSIFLSQNNNRNKKN